MSVNALPIVCLLLGQLAPADDNTPLEPIPMQSRFVQPATAPPRNARFGEPTLADPIPEQKAAPATPIDAGRSRVIRAGATESISSDDVQGPVAPALLKWTLTPPAGGGLSGRPLSLLEAIQQTLDRNRQIAIVKTYWNLTTGLADYHVANEEMAILAQIAPPQGESEAALLRAEVAASNARLQEAKLSAVAAQYDLVTLTQQPSGDANLPLPSDQPLVGVYRTQFDAMFRNRVAPIALKRIDRTLPISQTLIETRGQAVAAADAALIAMLKDYQEGRIGVASVLQIHRQRRDQRIAFLAAVRDYNHSIATYALSVASLGAGPRDVVSMLIETTPNDKSVLIPSRTAPSLRETPATNLVPVTPAETKTTQPPAAKVDLSPVPDKPAVKESTLPPSLLPKKAPTTLPPATKPTLPPIPGTSPGTLPQIPSIPKEVPTQDPKE